MKTKSISITNNWRGFEVIFRLHGVEPATERVSSFIFTLCYYVGLAVRDDLSGGVRTCMLSIYALFTGRKSYYFMPWFLSHCFWRPPNFGVFFFAFISIVTFFSLRLPVAIVVYDIGIFFPLRRNRSSSAGQEINRKMLICQKLVIINLT